MILHKIKIHNNIKHHRSFLFTILLLTILAPLLLFPLIVESKGIHVTLAAPWMETPFLQEGCEWASTPHTTNNHKFFKCLNNVWNYLKDSNNTGGAALLTQETQYNVLIHVMEKENRSSYEIGMLKMKLAARVYSPTVETHWQLARKTIDFIGGCSKKGNTFVLLNEVAYCDVQLLQEALETISSGKKKNNNNNEKINQEKETTITELFPNFDHIHPNSKGENIAIIYGIIGEEKTMQFLNILEKKLNNIRLIFRHYPVSGRFWDNALFVQGYGVTVDLKNVEYKAMDEKSKEVEINKTDSNPIENNESIEPIVGFNITLLKERYSNLKKQLNSFQDYLLETTDRDEVKVDFHIWETQNMGIAAVQRVMEVNNEGRLNLLLNLLTNFPIHASKLSKMGGLANSKMTPVMRQAITSISRILHPGQNLAFLNGRLMEIREINLFYLLEKLDEDEQLFEGIKRILTSHYIPSIGDNNFVSTKSNILNKEVRTIIESVQKRDSSNDAGIKKTIPRLWLDKENIFWINNIEEDINFAFMPSDIKAILHTDFSGMPTFPRKNIFHIVTIVDPITSEGQQSLAAMIQLEERKQPVRFGIIFVDSNWSPEMHISSTGIEINTESSISSITAFISATVWELLKDDESLSEVTGFLAEIKELQDSTGKISENEIQIAAMNALSIAGKRTLNDIIIDKEFLNYYHKTQEEIYNLHMKQFPLTLINGNVFKGGIMEAIRNGFSTELQNIKILVQTGKLENKDNNLYDSIMKLSGATKNYRSSLYEDILYTEWSLKSILDFLYYRPFIYPISHEKNNIALVSSILAIHGSVTSKNLKALYKVINQIYHCKDKKSNCNNIRLSFVICDKKQEKEKRTIMGDLELLLWSGEGISEKRRIELIIEFLNIIMIDKNLKNLNDPVKYEKVLTNINFPPEIKKIIDSAIINSELKKEKEKQELLINGFCTEMDNQLQLSNDEIITKKEGTVYYYVNGRRFIYEDNFVENDFNNAALQEISFAKTISNIIKKINFKNFINTEVSQEKLNNNFISSKIAALAALLQRDNMRGDAGEEKRVLPSAPGPVSFIIPPNNNNNNNKVKEPRHYFTIVIDPIARNSQLLLSLCHYMINAPIDAACVVHLNPTQGSEKPKRDFYQFVGDWKIYFDKTGRVVPPAAIFRQLPSQHLLTLGVEEPESWTVFPMEAKYDLDNIILSNLPQHSHYLYATYRINSILISGSAKESRQSTPPRGLPLLIRSLSTNITRDTLVMANLGYFQLQSKPGIWYLTVQPGNIAKAFYISHINDILVKDEANGINSNKFNYSLGQRIPLIVSSFNGISITIKVSKTVGHENVKVENLVLEEAPKKRGEWPPKGPQSKKPDQPTLNIFSVASGHLYERFLRMMMYSVVKNSTDIYGANTTRIKFWLIENFLSPQFKELVPLLAKHYGFDVGFVTYRWPWWLRKQSEKQRTIWGYKILFLDVLFPLEVDRIIFVDADQTVQSDLHELYNMNIGTAPTAYTPFCRRNPNTKTTNFRFWNHGFWAQHLQGRPYHISAIYLVDVRRLRAIAGGDKYRLVYSQLSRDPNSLANLDQDLPNYMQDQVPIFSLPEEWLWCETWCGEESKARAKTIDLCNNPLTKIPKLENAKKIIGGWEETDAELERVSEQLRQQHQ